MSVKAFIFSVGEPTTEACVESFRRLGFTTVLLQDPNTTLHEKYVEFLKQARGESIVVRCDADIIVSRDFLISYHKATKLDADFFQTEVFCFYRFATVTGGTKILLRPAIEIGLEYAPDFFVHDAVGKSRPETALWREPRMVGRTATIPGVVGVHGLNPRPEDAARHERHRSDRGQQHSLDRPYIDSVSYHLHDHYAKALPELQS